MSIQEYCIIGALQWLMANNSLYEDIQINYHLLETWEDKFISSNIMDSIVYCDSDQHKRKNYATDLNDDNFGNDFNTAIASTSIKRNYINSGCVYSNIDNKRQNSTL